MAPAVGSRVLRDPHFGKVLCLSLMKLALMYFHARLRPLKDPPQGIHAGRCSRSIILCFRHLRFGRFLVEYLLIKSIRARVFLGVRVYVDGQACNRSSCWCRAPSFNLRFCFYLCLQFPLFFWFFVVRTSYKLWLLVLHFTGTASPISAVCTESWESIDIYDSRLDPGACGGSKSGSTKPTRREKLPPPGLCFWRRFARVARDIFLSGLGKENFWDIRSYMCARGMFCFCPMRQCNGEGLCTVIIFRHCLPSEYQRPYLCWLFYRLRVASFSVLTSAASLWELTHHI